MSCAVALANIDVFEREDILGHVRKNEPAFAASLEKLLRASDRRRRPRGGLLLGHRARQRPSDTGLVQRRREREAARGYLSPALFEAGLICRADDRGDPVIQLSPPLICGEEQFEEMTQILEDRADGGLAQALSNRASGAPAVTSKRARHEASRALGDLPRSLWWDTLEEPVTPRAALDGDTEADVAIVGAGYTGLWTAHYLARADPKLRIVVLEQAVAGFGASGRNGGWCSAFFATSLGRSQKSTDAIRRSPCTEPCAMR